MKYFHRKRLEKLAAFLDKLPRQKFDFVTIAVERGKPMREALKAGKHACGTTACAIGWTPVVFPRLAEWDKLPNAVVRGQKTVKPKGQPSPRYPLRSVWTMGEVLFGLTNDESEMLFVPDEYVDEHLRDDATPKQVARHIRKFLKAQARASRSVPVSDTAAGNAHE